MFVGFYQHFKLYLMEAFGLFLFMVSACFFDGMLEHPGSSWNTALPNAFTRLLVMGVAMGFTALFIFLSPLTAPSGAFINPAVTLIRWRLKEMKMSEVILYSIFQCLGGLAAVYIMAYFMGNLLTSAPVNFVVTVPGKSIDAWQAAVMETVISFIMASMVLFTSVHLRFKKYTSYLAAMLVAGFVIVSGPVSGFGMNPARTLASAVPADIYTAFWIYMLMPFAGMLGAAELFLWVKKRKLDKPVSIQSQA